MKRRGGDGVGEGVVRRLTVDEVHSHAVDKHDESGNRPSRSSVRCGEVEVVLPLAA